MYDYENEDNDDNELVSEEITSMSTIRCESTSPHRKPNMQAFKPFCACCVGGVFRKGYTKSKVVSRRRNRKEARAKPKSKDHRNGLLSFA